MLDLTVHMTDSNNNATEHALHVDPRLSLAIQDLSRIELMAIHYPDSVANSQIVPSSRHVFLREVLSLSLSSSLLTCQSHLTEIKHYLSAERH